MTFRITETLSVSSILIAALAASVLAAHSRVGPDALYSQKATKQQSTRALAVYHDAMTKSSNTPAAIFVVSDPGDQPDDSLADGILDPPTLRAAVENANRFPDLDMITFAPSLAMVSKTTTSWPNVIHPVILDGLIADSGRVAIDGTTQIGGGGLVFLNGGCTIKNCEFRNFDSWGIILQANAGNTNVVQNCVFRDNGNAGINFNGSTKNLIGGMLPGERNYLCGNNYGMTLLVGSDSNSIMGNYIGTMDGEAADGNTGYGLWIETAGNLVAHNLISGNGGSAVYTSSSSAMRNFIESNVIGLDKDGTTALPNQGGVAISRGGSDTIRTNVISGNAFSAIGVSANAPDVVVEENFLGTDELGAYPIPNTYNGVNSGGRRAVIRGNLISGNPHGVEIYGGDSCIVRDNIIGDYDLSTTPLGNTYYGVNISGGKGHRIGGPGDEDGNLISGNGFSGIRLIGTSVTECVIEGNFIGTSGSGLLALGNDSSGIQLRTSTKRDTIRSNVICGNGLDGINISIPIDTLSSQHLVSGNLIGIAFDSMTVLPNKRFGIHVDSTRGIAIGAGGFPGNAIAGNDSSGIRIFRSRQNTVIGNLIGVLPDSTSAAANAGDGISLIRSMANKIGGRSPEDGNVIAQNLGAGIRVVSGTGNRIVGNVLRDNGFIGIDLVGQDLMRGVTLNDSADADTGANHRQNFPTLTYVARESGNATVHGYLEGQEGETYTIDFYSVNTPDPSGFGAGDSLLDSLAVIPDTSGFAYFTHSLTGNPQNIVATCTHPDGSTSEFSKSAIMVNSTGDGADIAAFDEICNSGGPTVNGVPECALRAALELAEKLIGPDYIGFEIPGVAPFTIHPNSELPHITEPTVINGTTQPGYVDGTPVIRLSGTSAGPVAGIFVEDDGSTIRGMSFTDFGAQGIQCSGDNLWLHDIRVTGNSGTGVDCEGDLTITGPLVASLNGTQVTVDAGIDVAGVLRAESTEVSGNHGRGIRAGWLSIKGNLIAEDNHGAGVDVINDVLVRGTSHSVSDNGHDGLVSQNGWVVVEGEIVVNNNGDERTPSECFTMNGSGIAAEKEIVLGQSTITGNCGHGLNAGSFVWLKGNCTIANNTEIGLFVKGSEARLDGPENEISDNGKTGLLCNNGIVRIPGRLTLDNNGKTVEIEDPDDCLPGLGDPRWEDGAHGLYASKVEGNCIISTNNCGAGVAGGELAITGIAKLDNNSSHGAAARVISIAAGEACYNDGFGIVVFNPGGIVPGGILSLGAVKICMNALGGILGKPSDSAATSMNFGKWKNLMANSASVVGGGSITDNLGDGVSWETVDSLLVTACNIHGNSGSGIAAAPGAGPVTASGVWWGSADGPGGGGPGSGDEVSSGVNYANWSTTLHALSISTQSIVYAEPGTVDSIGFSLSKWTTGDEQVDIHIIDTADWVSAPSDFAIPASDTAPAIARLELTIPGGTPEGSQAEIRIVATSESDPAATDTAAITVFTYVPQLASILIIPDSITLQPAETVNFFAFGLDQFAKTHPLIPMWSTDGGTITEQGLFTAASSTGAYTVTAMDTSGLVSAIAEVHISVEGCACDCHADPQCDGAVDIFDIAQTINVAFRNEGPLPDTNPLCPFETTDSNCDGVTDVFDVVRMVNVAFRNEDPASEFCDPCK